MVRNELVVPILDPLLLQLECVAMPDYRIVQNRVVDPSVIGHCPIVSGQSMRYHLSHLDFSLLGLSLNWLWLVRSVLISNQVWWLVP